MIMLSPLGYWIDVYLQPNAHLQSRVGLLILLSTWLAGSAQCVTVFLSNQSNMSFVRSAVRAAKRLREIFVLAYWTGRARTRHRARSSRPRLVVLSTWYLPGLPSRHRATLLSVSRQQLSVQFLTKAF